MKSSLYIFDWKRTQTVILAGVHGTLSEQAPSFNLQSKTHKSWLIFMLISVWFL